MISKLKKLLGIKPNDWRTIQGFRGRWIDEFDVPTGTCFHEIQYSMERNKFRIVSSGDRPKRHTIYLDAVNALSEYNRKLLSDLEKQKQVTK